MKKRHLAAVAVALISAGGVLLAQGTIIQRVLVKVNGEAFTQTDLQDRQIGVLRERLNRAQLSPQDLASDQALQPALAEITPPLLVGAIDELLILQKGRELGYRMTDEQFKDNLGRLKTDNQLDDAGLNQALAAEGLTLDTLRQVLERQLIMETVRRRDIMGQFQLTEQESRQYYDAHPDEFKTPPTVTLREILVAVGAPPAGRGAPSLMVTNTEEDARVKINALRARAEQGEDFVKLVTEASDAPSKSTGGLVGPVALGDMAVGIREVLEPLAVGGLTQPMRTTRGYQIFKLETRTTSELLPFDQVRNEIASKIFDERVVGETRKYLEEVRAEALIEWKREDLRQMYEKQLAASR